MTLTYLRTPRLASAALAVGFFLLAVVSSTSRGALIEYAWRGTIVPIDPAEDPWGISSLAKPFWISGVVDSGELDFDVDIDDARFALFSVELLIDGVESASVGDGTISFRELATSDSVSISLDEVFFNDTDEPFSASIRLPMSTFAFQDVFESPPLFPPAMTITLGSSVREGSSYRTSKESGATVTATVVPEPSACLLMFLAILGVTTVFWRSCARPRAT